MSESNKIATKLCTIDNLSMNSALSRVKELSQDEHAHIVVTPNIDHISRLLEADQYPEYAEAYENASLCLCDSRILQKLLKFKGYSVPDVVTGSTLTEQLFKKVLSPDDQITIIGAETRVIEKLRSLYPKLKLNHYNPPMGFINKENEVQKTIRIIETNKNGYIFLAVGSPRQEVLAKRVNEKNFFHGVMLCIGASILFLVDEEKRAPEWMQKAHIEWLYRMMQDPKRLVSRYWDNFLRLLSIYKRI